MFKPNKELLDIIGWDEKSVPSYRILPSDMTLCQITFSLENLITGLAYEISQYYKWGKNMKEKDTGKLIIVSEAIKNGFAHRTGHNGENIEYGMFITPQAVCHGFRDYGVFFKSKEVKHNFETKTQFCKKTEAICLNYLEGFRQGVCFMYEDSDIIHVDILRRI